MLQIDKRGQIGAIVMTFVGIVIVFFLLALFIFGHHFVDLFSDSSTDEVTDSRNVLNDYLGDDAVFNQKFDFLLSCEGIIGSEIYSAFDVFLLWDLGELGANEVNNFMTGLDDFCYDWLGIVRDDTFDEFLVCWEGECSVVDGIDINLDKLEYYEKDDLYMVKQLGDYKIFISSVNLEEVSGRLGVDSEGNSLREEWSEVNYG